MSAQEALEDAGAGETTKAGRKAARRKARKAADAALQQAASSTASVEQHTAAAAVPSDPVEPLAAADDEPNTKRARRGFVTTLPAPQAQATVAVPTPQAQVTVAAEAERKRARAEVSQARDTADLERSIKRQVAALPRSSAGEPPPPGTQIIANTPPRPVSQPVPPPSAWTPVSQPYAPMPPAARPPPPATAPVPPAARPVPPAPAPVSAPPASAPQRARPLSAPPRLVVLLCGPPGAGKSRFAAALHAKTRCACATATDDDLVPWQQPKTAVAALKVEAFGRLTSALRDGGCVIVDRCNFDAHQRAPWIQSQHTRRLSGWPESVPETRCSGYVPEWMFRICSGNTLSPLGWAGWRGRPWWRSGSAARARSAPGPCATRARFSASRRAREREMGLRTRQENRSR